ncbi:MAG: class A beta-lactamase [Thermoanaerobaculia bacterium]
MSPLNVLFSMAMAALALSSPVSDPPDSAAAAFREAVAAAEADSGGIVGVTAVHVESGRRLSVRGSEAFQMASVFKLPVALAVFARVDSGTVEPTRRLVLDAADHRNGPGPLDEHFNAGMTRTVLELVEAMVIDSDNTAADKLVALVGGPVAVEKTLRELSLGGIDVSLDERGMGAAWKKNPAAFEAGPRNAATPDATATLLVRLFNGDLLSRASTHGLLDILRRCRTGGRRIRAGLPEGTEVLDKTGTMGGSTNDAGIVTLPQDGGHLALVVFVKASTREVAVREAAIARIARTAWLAFVP